MKKEVKIIICLLILLLVTGCNTTKKEEKQEKSKGKCDVLECINLIEVNDTLEKINETIGFEGSKVENNIYKWKLNSTDSVIVTFNETSNEIKIKFLDDLIKNSKTNFSNYSKLEEKLKNGETVTLDDLNTSFKSKATLIEKSSTIQKYRWVDSEESYLEATINITNGKCSQITGMI